MTRETKGLIPIKIILVLVIAIFVSWFLWHRQSENNPADKFLKSIPAQSRERAKKAGYYCPSWDAKPGEVVVQYCTSLPKK